jgi:hypothetical protein
MFLLPYTLKVLTSTFLPYLEMSWHRRPTVDRQTIIWTSTERNNQVHLSPKRDELTHVSGRRLPRKHLPIPNRDVHEDVERTRRELLALLS